MIDLIAATPPPDPASGWMQAAILAIAFLGSIFAAGLWRTVGSLEAITTDLKDTVKSTADGVDKSLAKVSESVGKNSSAISAVDGRLARVEAEVSNIKVSQTGFEQRFNVTREESNKSHENLSRELARLVGAVEGMKK